MGTLTVSSITHLLLPNAIPSPDNHLAIDPGGTTGIAMRVEYIDPQGHQVSEIITLATREFDDLCFVVDRSIWSWVVVEKFVTGGKISRWGTGTTELVGAVRSLCWHNSTECVVRINSQRGSSMEESKAILSGCSHVDHEVDALAHMLAWEHLKEREARGENINASKVHSAFWKGVDPRQCK